MRVCFLISTCVLFSFIATAQTSAETKHKTGSTGTRDVTIDNNTSAATQCTSRKTIVISKNPIPKADPAREAVAKRNKPVAIKDLDTN